MVKDKNPQTFSGAVTETAANTYTQLTTSLPTYPTPSVSKGKAVVLEFLKVWFYFNPDALVNNQINEGQLTYKTQTGIIAFTNLQESVAFFKVRRSLATNGAVDTITPLEIDLTDGAGNGLLVASQNLYFGVKGSNNVAATIFAFKVLYRYKEVDIQEYVGIVQSQS